MFSNTVGKLSTIIGTFFAQEMSFRTCSKNVLEHLGTVSVPSTGRTFKKGKIYVKICLKTNI